MSNHLDSVTQWLTKLKSGDDAAAQELWSRYVERLVCLARAKLGESPRRVADEEDVAIVAFNAFLRGVKAGRFSKLDDRDDLWQVLVMLTGRKAVDQVRAQASQKRGHGQVRGDSVFRSDALATGFARIAAPEPTPEFAFCVAAQLQEMLQLLDEPLDAIALAKIEGYTNAEIATRVGCSLSSVERKLILIRQIWQENEA